MAEKSTKLKTEKTKKTDKSEVVKAKKPTLKKDEPVIETTGVKITAKAGKRSAKAVKADELKLLKEERKKSEATEETKPITKKVVQPTRSRLERRGKKYQSVAKLVESNKNYPLAEGIALAVKTSPSKFDATVELHINLNVDPRHADQNIRGVVNLPSGTGKELKIAVVADEDKAAAAKKAGADLAGLDNIFALLEKEELGFDVLIATPSAMPKLGKYAKLLGPKGLMPNPKSGTVTDDITKAVQQAKAGRLEYRVDSTGILHAAVGKVGFGEEKLKDNIDAVFGALKANKPASVKGTFINSAHISTTMGPGIKIDIATI